MKQMHLLLALVIICTSWVNYVQSSEQDLKSIPNTLSIERSLQESDPCVGNFNYNFSDPKQSYLPPLSAKCKTIGGNLYLTSCLKAKNCVLPMELANVEVIEDTLVIYNLATIPKNKLKALGTLNIVYGAVKSLKPLSGLTTVSNALYVAFSAVTSLEGLHNIEETGTFSIANCPISKSIPMKLKKVASFSLFSVPLTTLDGFSQLETTETLLISSSGATSLSGFKNLKHATNLMITQNNGLSSIILPALTEASLVAISENHSLRTVSFPLLKNPQYMVIDSCFNLETIENVGAFDNGAALLSLGNLPRLKSIQGLKNATSINSLLLYNSTLLESLDGLENLHDAVTIYVNELLNLKSLKGLRSVHHASILVFNNLPMVEYADLDSLTMVKSLAFSQLPMLKSFKGLSNLIEAEQFGIQGPAMIKDFAEVPNLAKLKAFYVFANGLTNLESIAVGTGNLGKPNVYLSDHEQTMLKWKPTKAFLVKVCPKNSKITWNGCPGKGLSSVIGEIASASIPTYKDLDIPNAEQIRDDILTKLPDFSR